MRRAFSLLELIIAIVVIALSIAALPFVVGGAMRGNSAAIVQEMITATKSVISDATTYPWNSNYSSEVTPDKIWRTTGDTNRFSNLTLSDSERFFTAQRQYFGQASSICNYDVNTSGCLEANDVNSYSESEGCGGINCLDGKSAYIEIDEKSSNAAIAKHILDLEYILNVEKAKISEPANADTSESFTVTFGSGSPSNDALMIKVKSNLKNGEIDGVKDGVVLKAYSFNIGRAY